MDSDTLTLGGITFESASYAVPDRVPFGGKQAMKVHKLPGGSRVIDILGPDEHDIEFSGFILASNAFQTAQSLDAMRADGKEITFSYCGMSRQVVVGDFKATVRRYPNWVEYSVSCVVVSNPSQGNLSASPSAGAADGLVSSDLGSAAASASANPDLAGAAQ